MANTEVRVAASGCYEILMDNDSDGSNQFIIDHEGGAGAGTPLLKIAENGKVTLYGPVSGAKPIRLDNTAGGDVAVFQSNSTAVASILDNGIADFSTGGVKMRVVTSNPNGSLSGFPGQIVFWDDTAGTGSWYLCLCTGSPNTWKKSLPGS